jgi:hypothetical protein
VTRHLLVAITGHGYGHAAQTAPVVAALRALRPDLRVSLRCNLAPGLIELFFPGVETVTRSAADFGIPMRSAIDVDAAAAEPAFAALHRRFAAAVAVEAAALDRLRPDLVLANVGYVPIAAAARAGIPAIGFGSLNWLGILRGYAAGWRDADAILADMATSYRAARCFVRPTPAMAMPDLDTVQVGPVARQSVPRRAALAERLGAAAGERIVLVSLGGIDTRLDLAAWPAVPGLRYVTAALAPPPRPDMVALEALGISHIDCLASCDAVVTKPGYGTIVEAACHGVPTLFVRRGVWPEEPYLVDWFAAHATAREIPRAALEHGALAPELAALWAMARKPAVTPTGNDAAARLVAEYL